MEKGQWEGENKWKQGYQWGGIAVLYMSDNGTLNFGGSTKDRCKWVLEYILEIERLRLDDE